MQHYNCSRQSDSFSEQSSYVPLIQVPFLAPSSKGITSTNSKNATTSFENVIAAPITKSISDKATSIPLATLPSTSVHPMQTRSKSGIFKPKVLTAMLHCEPSTVPLALADPRWKEAMETEYQALLKNNTWELVPPGDAHHIIRSKWVFRAKLKADKYKVRLVAKGFQQAPGLDFSETFSPMIKASTIRIIFTLVVSRNWDIQQIDINNAFLNGDLCEDVFMDQPAGFVDSTKPTYVCKLHKALYGLKQAPRVWFAKLKSALIAWGFSNSVSDTSLFFTHKGGRPLFLLVYVDDILITGEDSNAIQQLIKDLNI